MCATTGNRLTDVEPEQLQTCETHTVDQLLARLTHSHNQNLMAQRPYLQMWKMFTNLYVRRRRKRQRKWNNKAAVFILTFTGFDQRNLFKGNRTDSVIRWNLRSFCGELRLSLFVYIVVYLKKLLLRLLF